MPDITTVSRRSSGNIKGMEEECDFPKWNTVRRVGLNIQSWRPRGDVLHKQSFARDCSRWEAQDGSTNRRCRYCWEPT